MPDAARGSSCVRRTLKGCNKRILESGLERVHYEATGAFYFAAPGGQVFAILHA